MFDREVFVEECRASLADSDPARAVRDLLERTVADRRALPVDLEVPRVGATTWYRSSALTVQCIVWPQGVVTPPHEHRMWAVVGVLGGQEDNTLWRRTEGGLEPSGGCSVAAGQVLALGSDAVHAVSNPCRTPTIGLHVYGGDILATRRSEWDHDGGREHPFEASAIVRFLAELSDLGSRTGRSLEELDFDEVRAASFERYGKAAAS